MGKADVSIKQWLKNKERFADLFNGLIFNGRRVILSDDLIEGDGEADIMVTDKNGKDKAVQRYRDVVMKWKNSVKLTILAIESQEKVHYAMPVRNMLYDSLSYTEQIKILWKGIDEKEKRELSEAEIFSKFRKRDRLMPVLTIVFYHGEEEWDGATELYQLIDAQDDSIVRQMLKKYVPNYKLNLLNVCDVENTDRFRTDLHIIFDMIKCRNDKKQMRKYKDSHKDEFIHMDTDTAYVMKMLLKVNPLKDIEKYKNKNKEEVNMCKAIDDMLEDERMEGREEGVSVLIKTLTEMGCSRDIIFDKLLGNMNLTESVASQYMDKYCR